MNECNFVGWCLIPPTILASKELNASDKLLLGRIMGLLTEEGYCFASNAWLGKQIGLEKDTIKKKLIRLARAGFVRIEVIRDENGAVVERRIYPQFAPRGSEKSPTPVKKITVYRNREEKENIINNRDKPLEAGFSGKGTVSESPRGLTSLKEALKQKIEALEETRPKRKMPDWMFLAFEYARSLGINLDDPVLKKHNAKARWLSLFKSKYAKERGKLAAAYSYLVDHPGDLGPLQKVKLFFWRVAQ
ncbi:helix-turn-helix domain-containing protein [bacterium]|nr:helix-turn-helix domain-containing protein [bacterium]